jgi:hypothetical protein
LFTAGKQVGFAAYPTLKPGNFCNFTQVAFVNNTIRLLATNYFLLSSVIVPNVEYPSEFDGENVIMDSSQLMRAVKQLFPHPNRRHTQFGLDNRLGHLVLTNKSSAINVNLPITNIAFPSRATVEQLGPTITNQVSLPIKGLREVLRAFGNGYYINLELVSDDDGSYLQLEQSGEFPVRFPSGMVSKFSNKHSIRTTIPCVATTDNSVRTSVSTNLLRAVVKNIATTRNGSITFGFGRKGKTESIIITPDSIDGVHFLLMPMSYRNSN